MEEIKKSDGDQNGSRNDVEQSKVLAVIGYLGILFLVPMLAAPKSKFAQYHAKQGMVLFITSLILWIAAWFLALITFGLGMFLFYLLGLAVFALMIIGIVNASQGKTKPLPVIGNYVKIK